MQTQTTDTATVNLRDVKADMAAFMRDRGDCTRDDLLQEFTPKQIDQYANDAAREANRQANRRFS